MSKSLKFMGGQSCWLPPQNTFYGGNHPMRLCILSKRCPVSSFLCSTGSPHPFLSQPAHSYVTNNYRATSFQGTDKFVIFVCQTIRPCPKQWNSLNTTLDLRQLYTCMYNIPQDVTVMQAWCTEAVQCIYYIFICAYIYIDTLSQLEYIIIIILYTIVIIPSMSMTAYSTPLLLS